MAGNNKKSKNFLVSKIGGQQLIVLGVVIALFVFFFIGMGNSVPFSSPH